MKAKTLGLSPSFAMQRLLAALLIITVILDVSVVDVEAQGESLDDQYMYLDAEVNSPVQDYVLASPTQEARGDFRKSKKPKIVEFYSPFCVSYFKGI